MMGWALAGLAIAKDPCADEAAVAERSASIRAMYEEGEAERADRSVEATSVLERDEARVKSARKLDRKGQLCTADDKWYAAWVMTQADDLKTLERAYELAQGAMEAHHANGAWLVAYTFDLKRVFGGYEQAYGTRTQVNERSQVCLVHVDPEVTDEERAQYKQPPIADAYRRVLDANGFTSDAPTLERLQRRGLYCPPEAGTRRAGRTVRAPGS